MQDAIIVGGGITGLTTGYLLQQKGLDISVVEKNLRPGGPIQSVSHNGFLIEKGPNSLLPSDPWIFSLIDELGLGNSISEEDPQAKNRYIVKDGKPVAAPTNPLQFLTNPLFSFRAKLRLLTEPFRKPAPLQYTLTESVSAFTRRRLGREFLDYAVDPFVSGIYAGNPDELILKDAFPTLHEFEQTHGSLFKGAKAKRKQSKSTPEAPKKRSVNFDEGLQMLPRTIARKLGNRLWLGSTVVAINRNDQGWQVTWKQDGENFEGFAKNLFICLPSRQVKTLAWPQPISEWISNSPDLPYPTVHSLALGYRRDQIAHPLDGFGALVPSKEKTRILGALFSSSLYPSRAPEEHCLLTTMLGGRGSPELADASESELLEIATTDLQRLFGITGEPMFHYLTTWKHAIPQYTKNFRGWKECIQSLESDYPGLRFGGNSIDGIAISASLLSAKRLADELTQSS